MKRKIRSYLLYPRFSLSEICLHQFQLLSRIFWAQCPQWFELLFVRQTSDCSSDDVVLVRLQQLLNNVHGKKTWGPSHKNTGHFNSGKRLFQHLISLDGSCLWCSKKIHSEQGDSLRLTIDSQMMSKCVIRYMIGKTNQNAYVKLTSIRSIIFGMDQENKGLRSIFIKKHPKPKTECSKLVTWWLASHISDAPRHNWHATKCFFPFPCLLSLLCLPIEWYYFGFCITQREAHKTIYYMHWWQWTRIFMDRGEIKALCTPSPLPPKKKTKAKTNLKELTSNYIDFSTLFNKGM